MKKECIVIKPHHFMDIIKLYGSGIKVFMPDQKMGHDFYKVANTIIDNPTTVLQLTIESDAICQPCKMLKRQICSDGVCGIEHTISKDQYNKMLDKRIITTLSLSLTNTYTAKELCMIMYQGKECIFDVWQEEDQNSTNKRYELFVQGATKYLKIGR